MTHYRVFCN